MAVQVKQIWSVKSDTDKKITWFPEVQNVGGVPYAKITKWDRGYVRFSTGKTLKLVKGKSTAFNSPIIDQLKVARQTACNKALVEANRLDDPDEVATPVRAGRKRKARPTVCKPSDLHLIPAVVRAEFDSEWTLRMLTTGLATKVMWIELNAENMEQLQKRTKQALANGEHGHRYKAR